MLAALMTSFLLLLLSTQGTAQVATAARSISGKVIANGKPIAGATVAVKGTSDQVATNAAGQFNLSLPREKTLCWSRMLAIAHRM